MSEHEWALLRGRVFAELGWLPEAELVIAEVLERTPHDLDALSLLAKIKHMRGELSHAIACWGQIHGIAAAPHGVLSHHPERPRAELDRAFALFQSGRPSEARAWCAAVATQARDPHDHRHAVLAGAWVAETCGDLGAARDELEALGREPAFAHDPARLHALLRVYDRIGTPDALRAAVQICRHVLAEAERTGIERLSILGHLAALERRAGNTAIATELDARFVVATRRRMHRATLGDLVRVAAREYIPIAELRARARVTDEPPSTLARRERALVHVIRREAADALSLLADAEPLDRVYLAELAAEAGDHDRAIALFLSVLDEGAGDPRVLGRLLAWHPPHPQIARYWAAPRRRARTFAIVEAHCRLAPQRADAWRWLAALHALAGEHDDAARCATRAAALAQQANPIGRVLAAGVYHLGGRPKGLLHEIWVERRKAAPGLGGMLPADEIHGNITAELRAAIRNTFVSVKTYARTKLGIADVDDYTYAYKLPKEDEPSGGLSAGLPTALAFLSVFLQRPVAAELASSGAVVAEAHDVITIGRIGEPEPKVKAACHGNLRTLVLPLANRTDLEHSTTFPLAITNEIVRYAADLDHAVRLAFGEDVLGP